MSELHFFGNVQELADWRAGQPGGAKAPVAVDMPIGLPEVVGFRRCDADARDRLPAGQKSSVFQPPSRRLLACATEPVNGRPPKAREIFERARAAIAGEQERLDAAAPVLRRVSQQAAGILGKIAEMDELMGEPDRERWFVEVHPEMSLRAMAGERLLASKTSAHGQLERLELIGRTFPDSDRRIRDWRLGGKLSLLDILDAYAACWTALRWAATDGGAVARRGDVSPPLCVLGEDAAGQPERDAASGLAMRIVV